MERKTGRGCNCQPKRSDGRDADCLEEPPETWQDLWSIARYDLGLSWKEFDEITPSMFQGLCKRRNIRFKYERFAHAQTTAAIYNVNRASSDSRMVTAFDFVRSDKSSEAKAETEAIKNNIRTCITSLPINTSKEKFQEVRTRTIDDLTAHGRLDAESLFDSVFPNLKPQGNK